MLTPIPRIALLLAVLLKRSGKTRGRLSEKTLRLLSGRTTLRERLIENVQGALDDLGVMMVRLERGGFALVAYSALEGAPPLTASQLLKDRKGLSDEDLWEELEITSDESEE